MRVKSSEMKDHYVSLGFHVLILCWPTDFPIKIQLSQHGPLDILLRGLGL